MSIVNFDFMGLVYNDSLLKMVKSYTKYFLSMTKNGQCGWWTPWCARHNNMMKTGRKLHFFTCFHHIIVSSTSGCPSQYHIFRPHSPWFSFVRLSHVSRLQLYLAALVEHLSSVEVSMTCFLGMVLIFLVLSLLWGFLLYKQQFLCLPCHYFLLTGTFNLTSGWMALTDIPVFYS